MPSENDPEKGVAVVEAVKSSEEAPGNVQMFWLLVWMAK